MGLRKAAVQRERTASVGFGTRKALFQRSGSVVPDQRFRVRRAGIREREGGIQLGRTGKEPRGRSKALRRSTVPVTPPLNIGPVRLECRGLGARSLFRLSAERTRDVRQQRALQGQQLRRGPCISTLPDSPPAARVQQLDRERDPVAIHRRGADEDRVDVQLARDGLEIGHRAADISAPMRGRSRAGRRSAPRCPSPHRSGLR